MAAPADVKRELELIDNVEWRILSASSDEEKLQRLLKVYLAPLLLKAGSEHAAVRNKVRHYHDHRVSIIRQTTHHTPHSSYQHAKRSTN